MREAEMADLKKSFDEVKEAATGFTSGNLMTSLERDVSKSLDMDVLDKQAASPAEAAAIEPPAMPSTPEMPIPETFTEADAHAAASQPLAIVQEVQAEPAVREAVPVTPDALKDAKAS
jgi:sec-independent protein translocase protein TatB